MLVLAAFAGSMMYATAAEDYESAPYEVLKKDGDIEVRRYPDLMLVATGSKMDSQGGDGSFMKLFRYISGDNDADQKIAMTTPVFMQGDGSMKDVTMGFVMPGKVVQAGVPQPKGDGVKVRKRPGGTFAVIRFNGMMTGELARQKESELRKWIEGQNLQTADRVDSAEGAKSVDDAKSSTAVEAASYDAPYVPPAKRRNEVLVRLNDDAATQPEPK